MKDQFPLTRKRRPFFVRPIFLVVFTLASIGIVVAVGSRLLPFARSRAAAGEKILSAPDETRKADLLKQYGRLPLSFETNEGQTDQQVKFLSRGPGYDLFLTGAGAVLTLRTPSPIAANSGGARATAAVSKDKRDAAVVRFQFKGANPNAIARGAEELPGKINYLIGNDPAQWRTNIPTYRRVRYEEIYSGVDMVYYGNQQQLEYDFVVSRGGNVHAVRFKIEGADRISIESTGDLSIRIDGREIQLHKPVIYQITDSGDRQEVVGNYILKGNEVSFHVEGYDKKRDLVIDPVLSYSTYFGPSASSVAVALDSLGNAYLTGTATSGIFPTTSGSFKSNASTDVPDAFVTKLNPTGTALIYSTFLGGGAQDMGASIAVDSVGSAYVTGNTNSSNFPTANPIRSSTSNLLTSSDAGAHWNGGVIGSPNGIVNVLAVDPTAPNIIYAGMGLSAGGGIYKTTDAGNTWFALNTGVTNVNCLALVVDPVTPSTLYAGMFVNNNPSASGLYKSVDGGSTWNHLTNGLSSIAVSALAIDPSSPTTVYAGSTFVGVYKTTNAGASWTNASTGINYGGTTAIAVDPQNPSVVYLSAGGGGVFKTTNGGSNWSQVNSGLTNTTVHTLNIDAASNVYAGTSGGGLFKSTNAGANWTALNNGLPAFTSLLSVALVPSNPSTIYIGAQGGRIYKTIDGGSNWNINYETLTSTSFTSIAINPLDVARVYAGTQIGSQNDYEAFVSKLNPSGSGLVYSTYLGGTGNDFGRGIAVDSSNNVYVTGQTGSATFPTVAAIQSSLKGTSDAFVTKFTSTGQLLTYSTYVGGDAADNANGIAVDGAGNAYITGNTASTNFPLASAFQSTLGDSFFGDAFVTKLGDNGALAYSTYLGGNFIDTGYGIAVDSSGNAYITGSTNSSNFPTANPVQATSGGTSGDAFITKLNGAGSGLVYSTYLGGSSIDVGRGIAVDGTGNAYVAGFSNSGDFPVVAGTLRNKSPLYISSDAGSNWINENYGLKNSVASLLINPATPSTILASSQGGVYKSTDGGRNWILSSTGLVRANVVALVNDPLTPSTVYLAASFTDLSNSAGVYKSIDGGTTWSAVNNGLGNGGAKCLAIDPLTPSTLYTCTLGRVYKTTDSGGSWTPIGPSILTLTTLVVDPLNPTTIYGAASDCSGCGVSKSTDGGMTWQSVNTGLANASIANLAVDPVTPSIVYAGGFQGLFKSINGGGNWTLINQGLVGVKAIDSLTPTTLYAIISGGGISKSTDGGTNWTVVNKGFLYPFVLSILINPTNHSTIYAGAGSPTDDDAFVTKINPSGTALTYSTLLGGSGPDEAYGLALDSFGHAFVTGGTQSSDFPTTADSYLPIPVGSSFVAEIIASYQIDGHVFDVNNAPVNGAEVTLNDGTSLISVMTETDGSYQFSHLREGGSFTVSAAKPNFTMSPTSQSFNNLTSNQTLDFVATATNAPFYSVSGQVTNNGVGLSGVTITLSGSQSSLRTTDGNGSYSFTLAGGGNYTFTPSILGFSFTPANQTFNNLSADQTLNFAANRQNFVVTNANDHGTGSLRQAILDANATQGLDTITFNIPGSGVHTINLLIGLPTISDPVILDATTQPAYAGSPLIELNGLQAGSSAFGFQVTAGGSTIRGFAIGGFTSNIGIWLSGNGGNTIQGNYVGVDPTGMVARRNNGGIQITNGSSNNLIGGTTASARNVISGNNFTGIFVGGSGNQIQGNFIGTNAAGTAALGNGTDGVNVSGSPAFTNNVIGGTAAGAGNLISGNQRGVYLLSPGNTIQGNLIGTDATGTKSIGNGTGIDAGVANTVVGGTIAGARNIISGNTGGGVAIGGAGSLLQGNFIGTDITGTACLGNGGTGAQGGTGLLIGGTTPEARNIISCNAGFGNVSPGSSNPAAVALVQGNYIGTDVTGNVALNNPLAGVSIQGSNTLIGGLTPGSQNVIAGNSVGIQVGGSVAPGPVNSTIQGNIIGLNASGTLPLPNSQAGIQVSDSSNNIIGGIANGAGNKIVFNNGPGVMVFSGTGNVIRGNAILSNNGLGIDLGSIGGVTPNDPNDADTGANNLQNFPVLTLVNSNGGSTAIQGTLNSKPNTAFIIDFYSNAGCDPSGNGEGALFFATTNVITDGNGNATIAFTASSALDAGRVLTATATDPSGNTSEFSPCDATNAAGSLAFDSYYPYNVLEDVGTAVINVVRTGGTRGTLTVNYSSADGTATAGLDYTTVSGTLTFADGETTKSILLPIVNDGVTEPDESLRLFLSSTNVESLGGSPIAEVIIQDNNTPLYIRAIHPNFPDELPVTEGDSGTTNAIMPVYLSAQTSRTVTVDFTSAGSPATSGVDFVPVNGTLTFAPTVTTRTITIPIIGDTLDEGNETFAINFSNPVNALIGTPLGIVRILDDDPSPVLTISDASVTEGNSGTTSAVFNLTLSPASGRTVSVSFSTANNSATAGTDYVSTSGSISFTAGQTAKTISVTVNGDAAAESDETFFVNLFPTSTATLARTQAVGTILDDDTLRLLLDSSGPDPNQAAAVDSLLLVRDPFYVLSIANWWNMGMDGNTRVTIFAVNLTLNQGETAASVIVNLVDNGGQSRDIQAEDVMPVPNSNFTQVTFRLPDNLPTGTCVVAIKAHNQTSNIGRIRIAP